MSSKRTAPGRPFKPGASGNPAGRPPGVSGIRKAILRALGRKTDGKRAVDALVDALTVKALGGNLAAAKLLIEYAYGKPATVYDAVVQSSDNGSAMARVMAEAAARRERDQAAMPLMARLAEAEERRERETSMTEGAGDVENDAQARAGSV